MHVRPVHHRCSESRTLASHTAASPTPAVPLAVQLEPCVRQDDETQAATVSGCTSQMYFSIALRLEGAPGPAQTAQPGTLYEATDRHDRMVSQTMTARAHP